MYMFGVGRMWGYTPDGSPVEFGELQSVSVDFSFDQKTLSGSKQLPVKMVRGKGKIEAKASFARIKSEAIGLILGGIQSSGHKKIATESVNIPASAAYTITVAQGAYFEKNLGVVDVSSSLVAVPMKKVPGSPAAGEYAVDTSGVYTFGAADAGKPVQITYMYNDNTSGTTITLANEEMGSAPQFSTLLNGKFDGKQISVWLSACISTKLGLALKQEDFLIPDFDIGVFAGPDGSPGWISLGE